VLTTRLTVRRRRGASNTPRSSATRSRTSAATCRRWKKRRP